jgi:predicted nucleotidyltransferase
MDRQRQLTDVLEHIMQTLISEYHPQKVILFGSMAKGEIDDWSDIDLVIIKETPKRFLARLKEVALLCRAPVGVDYLVYTPSEFEQMASEGRPFIQEEVLRKGKVLYER